MKKTFLFLILIFLFNFSFANAEENLIDIEYSACMEKNFSTAGMNNCTAEARLKWEKEIQKNIKLINKELNKEQRKIFDQANKKWDEYYNAEKQVIFGIIFNLDGTIHTNIAHGQAMSLARQHALDLEEILYELKDDCSVVIKDDEVKQNSKDAYRFKTSDNEPEAQKILYDYVYEDIKEFLKSDDNPDEFTLNDAHAFGYDLNNDGEKEIIGYAISKHTVGSKGITDLYILQKKGNSYEDISRTIFFPQLADIVILEAKHDGYNKIYLESKFVIQYNKDKKHYDWAYTLDLGEYKRVHQEN